MTTRRIWQMTVRSHAVFNGVRGAEVFSIVRVQNNVHNGSQDRQERCDQHDVGPEIGYHPQREGHGTYRDPVIANHFGNDQRDCSCREASVVGAFVTWIGSVVDAC